MWRPKSSLHSKSEPPKQSEWVQWTDVSSSNLSPIAMVQEGSLQFKNSRVSHGTCVSRSSSQHAKLPTNSHKETPGKSIGNKPSTRYVNQQGHSVKMARLADPSPLISFPVKGPSLKDSIRPRKKLSSTNIAQENEGIKGKKFNCNSLSEIEKHKEDCIQINHPTKSGQSTSKPCNEKHNNFNIDELKMPNSAKSFALKGNEVLGVIKKRSSGSHNILKQSECVDAYSTITRRQPSVIKEELENGLKKITADLIALKVLESSGLDVPAEITYGKGDHKRPLPVEQVTEDSEESKENNSPCKRIRGIHSDPNCIEKINFSRPSLSGSRSNVQLLEKSQEHRASAQSVSSINAWSKKEGYVTNNVITSQSPDKPKSYDPEKAREYIRRQKKERINRLKAERERKKADLDARRQKLNELSRTSMKLVKASIKPKSPSLNDTVSLKLLEDSTLAFSQARLNDCTNNAFQKQSSEQSVSVSGKMYCDFQGSGLDISSPDLSNSQLIRDISDMKSKIEAMAKTLKTTIVGSRSKRSFSSIKSEKKVSALQTPPFGSKEESVTGLKSKSPENKINNEEQNVVDHNIDVKDIMQTNVSPAYLHNLTSNLRKMRESLQNVLSQSEIRSRGDSVELEPAQNVSKVLSKHRRFSSAGSVSAFESVFSDDYFSKNSQKRQITTSFPTLPLASTNHFMTDRAKRLKATSEADISGKVSDLLAGTIPLEFHEAPNLDSKQNTSTKEDVVHESQKRSEEGPPAWLDKFTGKPYPINIISAVKRKLGVVPKNDALDESNLQGSLRTTVSQGSDNLIGTLLSSNEVVDRTFIPPTVTVRPSRSLAKGVSSISSAAPDLVPPSFGLGSLERRETFSGLNTLKTSKEGERSNLRPSLEACSMLEALNLEKMNIDFTNALNCSPYQSDVVPAEKPLSAPNTPAKSTTKQVSKNSRSSVISNGRDESEAEDSKSFFSEQSSNLLESNSLKHPDVYLTSDVSNGTTSLVAPNINLCTGRVDEGAQGVDKWISQFGCNGHTVYSGGGLEENVPGSLHQSNPNYRETFEIGHVFNPTALHLQFQAELNILDSFNESLCQVMEIEKVRAVSLARHQALLENCAVSAPKEDKSVDVQKSLIKSNSQISSINYARGSGDLSDLTLRDTRSSSLGMVSSEQLPDDNLNLSVQKTSVSPSSAMESDTMLPSVAGNPQNHSHSEHTGHTKTSQQSPSTGKSISEEIQSSDNMSEAPNPVPVEIADDQEIKCKAKAHGTAQNSLIEQNEMKTMRRTEEALSIDVTVNSFNGDSSLSGNDTFLIESLSRSHVFPSLTSGEDMFQFTLQMLEQLMHEEELRVQHKNTLLKLRVKVLGEMARAEVASLDLDKKKLREKGEDGHRDQITALRKKQRGIMLRFQQQREDIERLRRTEDLAWQERRLMYLQQMHLVRMQVSTRVMLRKFEKTSENLRKKSRLVVRSIRETRGSKLAQKSLTAETNPGPTENAAVGLSLSHSSSVSIASLVSDASRSSIVSNSSKKPGGAADSESSHLEDRVLKGLNELESRCRDLKEREKAIHERRQSVEQIIQWRRKLEEEEHGLKDFERQAHVRPRSGFAKHALRDRSTSPFQFPDSGVSGNVSNGNGTNSSRSISDLVRTGRSNGGIIGGVGSQSAVASITEEVDSSIPEEISENTSKPSADSTPNATNTDQYVNESFESEISEIKTTESQLITAETTQQSGKQKEPVSAHVSKADSEYDSRLPRMSERSNKYPGVTIKVPLSPRLQRVQRRRYSSGSDDSMVLSQTETGSEQSDIEGRISALTEQLQQCKAEAERLRREAKRTRNERLIAKEQSLQKQLQAYESYICQLRTNLDAELKQSSVPIVRPQIKQPRVAPGKVASRRQDAGPIQASVLQATSPDVSIARKEYTEFEAVAIASEAASEATSEAASEATSEVPSDVASEVSENSSFVSNEAPSLVANKTASKEPLFSNQEERTMEAFSDTSETGSEILSAIITEAQEETSSAHLVLQEIPEQNEEFECSSLVKEQNLSDVPQTLHAEAVDAKDGMVESLEPVKSLTSEEDPEDVTELIEDEPAGESESGSSSEVIKVFLREKDRDSVDQLSVVICDQRTESVDINMSHITSRDDLVDRITNEILEGLVKECFEPNTHYSSSTYSAKNSQSAYTEWDFFINKSLTEAADDIFSIYRRKKSTSSTKSEVESGSSRSQDVRKRVHEILAETQSPNVLRAKGRVREMMVTTYGVLSPDDSPCGSPNLASSPVQHSQPSSPTTEDVESSFNNIIGSSSLDEDGETENKASNTQIGLVGVSVIDSDGVSQEWFDEDFGLTRSRREAEELRRQQLQIEQEIEQLQQQQAQVQEQVPYYYVREIPNKPPPPYTPPGQAPRLLSSSSSFSPPVEEIRAVCSDRPTILNCIASAVDLLFDLRQEGRDVACCDAPSSYIDAGFGLTTPSHLSEQELSVYKNSARVYRLFLFDLAKQLVINAYSHEQEDPNPPWLRPENWVRRRKALAVVPKTREMLHDFVSKQVLVLFGFVPKASKENLTIRWSRKKRDHVDELLVRESQEEERQWTNYEQDEAVVKNNVTVSILDSLLEDTVRVLSDIYKKRLQRQCDQSARSKCSVY